MDSSEDTHTTPSLAYDADHRLQSLVRESHGLFDALARMKSADNANQVNIEQRKQRCGKLACFSQEQSSQIHVHTCPCINAQIILQPYAECHFTEADSFDMIKIVQGTFLKD